MSADNIIILGDALKQRNLSKNNQKNTNDSEKELIIMTLSESLETTVEILAANGYNVNDADLLLDLEYISYLLGAALSRQKDIDNPNIKILDQIRNIDEEDN